MKIFFTKLLMIELSTRNGFIGSYNRYKNMGKSICTKYGSLTYDNYLKFVRSENSN